MMPNRAVIDRPDDPHEQLLSPGAFWLLLGTLCSLCVVVVAVAAGRALG
jgi:hypothetical protein